jgi:riboflavin-specific deaminase-like protein
VAREGPEAASPDLCVTSDGAWSSGGEVDAAARDMLDLYLPLAIPSEMVIGQVGQSLDGRVATASGHSHYVTGPEDLTRLHRVRALVDAVLVGAGTAISDRPQLTVRRAVGEHPARVVLDPNGRVPPDGPLFDDGAAPTLWIRGGGAPAGLASHVEVLAPPSTRSDGLVPPDAILELLAGRGLRRVLVEGGGATVSGFLEAGALHRLHVTVAPIIIGSGRQGLTLPPVDRLEAAIRPRCRQFVLGEDVLFDLDLTSSGSPGGSAPSEPSPRNARR